MRIEKDIIGERQLPDSALYGIHALRASENFPDKTPFHIEWFKAIALVKKAYYITCRKFIHEANKIIDGLDFPIVYPDDKVLEYLISSTADLAAGNHFEYFIPGAIQGGAGTSINMACNEIICNNALLKAGHKPGDYHIIDPVEHANVFQSTNDVIPSSLKVAVLKLLPLLQEKINLLRAGIEEKEKQNRNTLRLAYTQMQSAVPSSYGFLFAGYNDALSRDWWRISKCAERLKMLNLGGGAIGTGIAIPRFVIMEVVSVLQQLTHLSVSRAENLSDATANLDVFVEVHAVLKAHAVNLEKIVSDLRLLSSDVVDSGELKLPNRQAGSSIMPGKINPVIPEFVISCSHKIYANDLLITSLCAQGCLDLNAYIPVIGHALIETIKLLMASDDSLLNNLFTGLQVIPEKAKKRLWNSPAISTALIPYIGYHKATLLSVYMKEHACDIFSANKELNFFDDEKLKEILQPSRLLQEGYSLKELYNERKRK